MSETPIQPEETPAVEAPEAPVVPDVPPTVGQLLKEAREASGMSIFEVAQALRLSRKQIEALEANAWGELPGVTSVRGFVRNYARLVQLEPETLVTMVGTAMAGQVSPVALELPPTTRATLPHAGEPHRKDVAAVVTGVAVVVLAVAAFFFLPDGLLEKLGFGGKSAGEAPTVAASAPAADAKGPQMLPNPASPVEPVMPPASQPPATTGDAPAPAVLTLPATPAAPMTAAPAAAGPQALSVITPPPAGAVATNAPIRLNFVGASWVEIKGKDGKILFSQSNPAGSEKDVVGEGPYTLVVGNSAQVKLSYKGKPVDLEPHTKGAVARLTLE